MSEISDAARVQLFLADHAVADSTNKINALGVGFQVMALQANGFTALFGCRHGGVSTEVRRR
jgi:hypothetical protein